MIEKWWRDKNLLRAAREEYGSLEAAVLAIGGCSPSAAQKAWRELGMEKLDRGPRPKGTPNREALERLHARVYG